jgi:hypothetical protein
MYWFIFHQMMSTIQRYMLPNTHFSLMDRILSINFLAPTSSSRLFPHSSVSDDDRHAANKKKLSGAVDMNSRKQRQLSHETTGNAQSENVQTWRGSLHENPENVAYGGGSAKGNLQGTLVTTATRRNDIGNRIATTRKHEFTVIRIIFGMSDIYQRASGNNLLPQLAEQQSVSRALLHLRRLAEG